MPRVRSVILLVTAMTTTTAVGGVGAGAQLPPIDPPDPPTTTTTAPPPTTPPPPPTTQRPPPAPGTAPARPGQAPPGDPQVDGGDSVEQPGARTVPPDAQRVINSVRRTGGNSTKRLLDALAPLEAFGLSREEIIRIGFGRFPMGGEASYSHDWLYPRFTPTFHLHKGTDIFAAHGTPVRSPADGVFTQSHGAVGGLAAYVREGNGTFYYMAHLNGFPNNVKSGQRVKVGDIVGFNGDSGNAKGGAPHVHFEVHPRGGAAVDPKPFLDRWLAEALANAPKIIASFEANRPRAIVATGLTRRLPGGGDGLFAAPTGPSRAQLLWASSASPSGGPLQLAEAEAVAAVSRVDWFELARRREAEAKARRLADARGRALLAPLTPKHLRAALGLTEAAAAGG